MTPALQTTDPDTDAGHAAADESLIARKCTVTLVVPPLNEIVGMRAIMPQVRREWVDQIIILDGGSTDGTVEWARDNDYEVHVQREPGIRQAYMEVLPKVRGDVILTFSPDGNSIPELLPQLVRKIDEGYDMVIASRYKPPAKSADDDWVTAFGNWLFTRTVNLLHGGKYTDAMVIYRAYRTKLVRELELDQDRWYRTPEWLFHTRISWEPLLSARAARRQLKVAEIPGDEPVRLALDGGIDVIEHGHGVSEDTRMRLLDENAMLVSTLCQAYYHVAAAEEHHYPAAKKALWQRHVDRQRLDFEKNVALGIRYALGTDMIGYPTHPSDHMAMEFQLAVEWGMSAKQAIVAGTRTAAEVMGLEKDIGTLEKGKLADIIAVTGNPLEDIRILQRVHFVMKGGEVVVEQGRA